MGGRDCECSRAARWSVIEGERWQGRGAPARRRTTACVRIPPPHLTRVACGRCAAQTLHAAPTPAPPWQTRAAACRVRSSTQQQQRLRAAAARRATAVASLPSPNYSTAAPLSTAAPCRPLHHSAPACAVGACVVRACRRVCESEAETRWRSCPARFLKVEPRHVHTPFCSPFCRQEPRKSASDVRRAPLPHSAQHGGAPVASMRRLSCPAPY